MKNFILNKIENIFIRTIAIVFFVALATLIAALALLAAQKYAGVNIDYFLNLVN